LGALVGWCDGALLGPVLVPLVGGGWLFEPPALTGASHDATAHRR